MLGFVPLLCGLALFATVAQSPFAPVFAEAVQADPNGASETRALLQGTRILPLFPPASDPRKEGFARIVNRSAVSGDVVIHGIDDAGDLYGPVLLELAGGHAAHFNSKDLERGNAEKGISGGTGPGEGSWRVQVDSSLDLEALSYIRTNDGFLTAMHDVVPQAGDAFRVAIFNPAQNRNQRSLLRLVNPGSFHVEVSIDGIDDRGRSPGTGVVVTIPPRGARTLTAPQLEEGDAGIEGSLGDGDGKWRLDIVADQPIQAMSLLASPSGHLTNLSTVANLRRPGSAPVAEPRISGRREIETVQGQVFAIDSADVSGDGRSDIVVAVRSAFEDDRVAWFENLGGGAFSGERPMGPAIDRLDLVTVADLDADGDPDLLYTTTGTGTDNHMAWRENLGGGSFSDDRVIVAETDRTWGFVASADLDADGDHDVVATDYPGENILWYENRGGSISTERTIAQIDHRSGAVHVTDVDGDGDPDIVLAAAGETSGLDLVWLENRGGSGFSGQQIIAEAVTQLDAYLAADLDNDGDADIVTIYSPTQEIAWYENQGGGRFAEKRTIARDAQGISSANTADFDGDGDLDLLCFYHDNGKIAWYRNLGGGVFSGERLIATEAGNPAWLVPADIDGDGNLDVLVAEGASFEQETIAWYENLRDAQASIEARIVAEVGQIWVTWNVEPATGGGAGHRFRVTAVSEDGTHRRECTATFAGGCTVTELVPGRAYRVTVAVEGEAFRATTVNATPLEDAPVTTDFSEPIAISTGGDSRGPGGLLAVDLDGDGDADLVDDPRRADPQPVAWRENLGEGSFSERRILSDGRVDAVDAADLDGDGDADLLSADRFGRALSWYENLGNGSISEPRPITAEPGRVPWVRTADLDGDGDPDAIAPTGTGECGADLCWYENRGDGSFGPGRPAASSSLTLDVLPVDLDGDGDLDLLGATSGYGTSDYKLAEWFENLGRGEFSSPHQIRTEDRDDSALRPADLDGDGARDVLAVGLFDGEISWYRNLGGGRFSGQRLIAEHESGGSFDSADLDGDGDTDLVYHSPRRGSFLWRENLGGGVLSRERMIAAGFEGDWFIAAADLNEDERTDLVATYWNRGETFWFQNLQTSRAPTEAPANVRVVGGPGTLWVTWDPVPDLGDSERAGARYLVTALAPDGSVAGECIASELIGCTVSGLAPGVEYEVTVQAENESGAGPVSAAVRATAAVVSGTPGTRFGPQRVITAEALGAVSVYAADLDGDADLDALSASNEDDTIAWYENSASGFLPVRHVISASADGADDVLAADLDDDGDQDVLSASFNDQKVAWYENLGGGRFTAQNVIAMDAHNLGPLHVADLDGDGDLDVLLAGPGEFGLDWHRNRGDATFDGPYSVSESEYNSAALASPADLDTDGDLDVLTTTSFNNGFGWHENLGNGSFSPARTIATGPDVPAQLATADLDSDGDPDILEVSAWDNSVAWFENRGGGVFYGRRVIDFEVVDYPGIAPADLDGDGDIDLLITTTDNDTLAWYENLDRGLFSSAHPITTQADDVVDAIAADLDGDGDADVLSASPRDNKIAWYENLGPG